MGCTQIRAPAQALRPSTATSLDPQHKAYLANQLSEPSYRPLAMFVTVLSDQSGYLSLLSMKKIRVLIPFPHPSVRTMDTQLQFAFQDRTPLDGGYLDM